jgi:hypothetical protein
MVKPVKGCIMKRFTVILPVETNSHVSSKLMIQAIESDIEQITGGYTAMPSHGIWLDHGMEYENSSITVTTLTTKKRVHKLLKHAHSWALKLQQISLLITVENTSSYFVAGISEQAKQTIAV